MNEPISNYRSNAQSKAVWIDCSVAYLVQTPANKVRGVHFKDEAVCF